MTTGVATAPVPVRITDADDPLLVATASVAFRTPPAVGAKMTCAVVDAPGLSVVASGAVAEKRAASTPVNETVVNTIGVALTLVSVTGCVAVVDTGTMPNVIVAGAAVSTTGGGVTPTVNDTVPVQPLTAVA